jgi:hypothetical protein
MASLGVNPHTISLVLDHISATKGTVTGTVTSNTGSTVRSEGRWSGCRRICRFYRPAPQLCSSCVSAQYPPLNADMPRWTEVPHFKSHHDYLHKLQLPNLLTPVEMAFPQRRRWQSRLCFPRRDCLFPEARGKSGRQVVPQPAPFFFALTTTRLISTRSTEWTQWL